MDWALLRRHGYVFRMEYEAFLARYKMLSVHTWPHWTAGGFVDGVTCLLRDLPISANEYAFGRTKIFIRTSKTVSDFLDDDDDGKYEVNTASSGEPNRIYRIPKSCSIHRTCPLFETNFTHCVMQCSLAWSGIALDPASSLLVYPFGTKLTNLRK